MSKMIQAFGNLNVFVQIFIIYGIIGISEMIVCRKAGK